MSASSAVPASKTVCRFGEKNTSSAASQMKPHPSSARRPVPPAFPGRQHRKPQLRSTYFYLPRRFHRISPRSAPGAAPRALSAPAAQGRARPAGCSLKKLDKGIKGRDFGSTAPGF